MSINPNVRTVASIAEQIVQMEKWIRIRAHELFLDRDPEPNRELEDWLAAEKEIISEAVATVSEEEDRFVARIGPLAVDFEDLDIQVTSQDILVSASKPRWFFKPIHFPRPIDAASVSAEYAIGSLSVTAAIADKPLLLQPGRDHLKTGASVKDQRSQASAS